MSLDGFIDKLLLLEHRTIADIFFENILIFCEKPAIGVFDDLGSFRPDYILLHAAINSLRYFNRTRNYLLL